MRVAYSELQEALRVVLVGLGFDAERADLGATLFAGASLDGVVSHGLNRFPRFVEMVRAGVVDVQARPERVAAQGALERWDGRRGPGNLNAWACMDRAIALSREHGIGAVALSNTNHWMRGGAYGWQGANAGAIGICWTNTLANLPPWGSSEPKLGNNPLVIAVPRADGHLVLDMAMSQFSYGALESYRRRGEELPVPGGFDADGVLTRNPAAIESSARPLPIGFWKGSGLALMLDVVAAVLSGGSPTLEIPRDPLREAGLSQMFVAFDARTLSTPVIDRIVEDLRSAAPTPGGSRVRYPGERTLETRRRNLAEGVPVDPEIWGVVAGWSGRA